MCKQWGSRKRAPVCVLLCLCSSSLRVNLFPQNIQLQTKGRSPECQRRCARRCDVFPYTFPQPAMWQMCCFFFPVLDPLGNTGTESYSPDVFISYAAWEDSERKAPVELTHLPPDSLQLGQVHATLRSLLPSWPNWSSSSTSLTRRWDRSLVFRVESVLSCQSPESGSSFIWMSGMKVYININTSSTRLPKKPAQWELLYYCQWLTARQQISQVKLHIKHSDQIMSWLAENVSMAILIIN